jgi:hypothetical protein
LTYGAGVGIIREDAGENGTRERKERKMTSTSQVGKFEGKGTVSLRVGGHGQEHIGKTIPAKTKSGDTKYVRLTKVVEDYGEGDVVVFACTFN